MARVELDADRLAALVGEAPRPPTVTVTLPDSEVQAALLIWGRSESGDWRAGVCYIHGRWSNKGLVTTWAPAVRVRPHHTERYGTVPRVSLPGDPSQWPPLPPRYPGAGEEWLATHQHVPYGSSPVWRGSSTQTRLPPS